MTADPPPGWFGHAGVELRVEEQLGLLRELRSPEYTGLFGRLRRDPAVSRGSADLVRNDYFPSPDAELYAAMIVRERPQRIVEVGSGFSTLVARHAIEHGGLECELCVVDPEPRVDVSDVADRIVRRRVEESGLSAGEPDGEGAEPPHDESETDRAGRAELRIEPDTLLFIDSTHEIEAGGDGPYLYCDLLPSLPAGVLVHVHDVYLPYDYPAVYRRWGYGEQYLLHALMAANERMEVVCAAYFLSREHPEAMKAAFGGAVAGPSAFQGASFWLRSIG